MRRKRGKAKDHNHDAIPNAGRNGEDIRPNGETEGGSRSGGEIALPATRSAGQERLEVSSFPKAEINGQVPPDIYLNFPFNPALKVSELPTLRVRSALAPRLALFRRT